MMPDLFGDTVTTPRGAVAKNLLNAAHGFPEFWAAWPRGPRKVAKQQCLDKWAKYGCAANATHIVQHVEAMKRSEDWTKSNGAFIPAPLVYLNQQRWEGQEVAPEDTESRGAVEALGVRLGVGRWDEITEQWPRYRARVLLAADSKKF